MSDDDLAFRPLLDISEDLRRRVLSSAKVTEAQLARIARLDDEYHSYATVLAERALAQAHRADAELARGIWRGPLHGVPIAVKDLVYTSFAPTAGGTAIHRDFVPPYSATVIERLEQAGAVLLGKLAMTEAAYTNHHPSALTPLNPWQRDYWVGTSSTGPGTAVSAALAYGALGSDTGGSIRFPCATCNLTGIKPTWGRVSRHGVFALASSLDHVGTMCRTAADAIALLGAIAGEDINDPTTLGAPVPDYLAALDLPIRGLRMGIDRAYTRDGVDPQVVAALDAAESVFVALGARIVEIELPPWRELVGRWMDVVATELAMAHRDTFPSRRSEYGPELVAFLDHGHDTTGLQLAAAAHDRLAYSGGLARSFESVDMLLIPTMTTRIPSLAALAGLGRDPNVLVDMLRYTAPFDFSGSPTITLPSGIDSTGLPLSLQLVGPHLSEGALARAAHAFQKVTDWHTRRPVLA